MIIQGIICIRSVWFLDIRNINLFCDVLLLGPVNHYYLGFFSNADGDSNVSLLLMSTEVHHRVQFSIEVPDAGYYENGTISAGTMTISEHSQTYTSVNTILS